MKVKICGIRRYEEARAALDAGAWALGFIFHRPSPRFLDPAEAGAIVRRLPRDVLSVGVFVDWPLEELNEAVQTVGLRGAQLHGAEDPEYARAVNADVVIKALRVSPSFRPEDVVAFDGFKILLDTYRRESAGGTGATFDWNVARAVSRWTPVILAGGIGPENVPEAIEVAQPDALDVSSGVEKAPGIKDLDKMRRLFDVVQECEQQRRGR